MTADAALKHQAAVEKLLGWGNNDLRDLPWRRTRDPWAILVAELMLQQTQVDRVVPSYTAFLTQFPTPAACARSPLADVVRAWDGLGYNRRAVYLHRAAQRIDEEHHGVVPDGFDALLELPGVGPYTARAVMAFAFERDVAVVDTNVGRVLARAFAGDRLGSRQAQALADELAPQGHGWEWNQIMLDFGARVCVKRAPLCDTCPIVTHCAWAADDFAAPDPAIASAGVTIAQSRFDGSDRQGRGRLVAALRHGPVHFEQLAHAAGWPDDPQRAERIARGLVAEGIAIDTGAWLTLPDGTSEPPASHSDSGGEV